MARAAKRVAPLTKPENLKEARTKQAKTNRTRAGSMERRIAAVLLGDKTPMSGAGKMKGDVVIPLANQPGRYLIECKLSAQTDNGEPKIYIKYEWLTKLLDEVMAMRARFGVLIVHFHRQREDYVFINREDLPILDSISGTDYFTATYSEALEEIDGRFRKNGDTLSGITLLARQLTMPLVLLTPVGPYVIISLTAFKFYLNNE